MAVRSCSADYGTDNVGSMRGIERATLPSQSTGNEMRTINPTAKVKGQTFFNPLY